MQIERSMKLLAMSQMQSRLFKTITISSARLGPAISVKRTLSSKTRGEYL